MGNRNNEEKFDDELEPKFGKKSSAHPRPKTTTQLKTMEKARKIHAMRVNGIAFEDIAEELGYADASGPWKLMQAYLKEVRIENGQDFARLENDRLEMAHRAMLDEMVNGKYKVQAALAIVRISESRRKLFGVDAPSRSEIEIQGAMSFLAQLPEGELDAIIAEGNNDENVLTYDDQTHKIIDAKVIKGLPHGDSGSNGKQTIPESGQGPSGDAA